MQVDPRYDGWWYEGGGIYRHVRLVTVDPVHVAPDGVFVMSSVANPGDGVRADATVAVNTDVTNTGATVASATVLERNPERQRQGDHERKIGADVCRCNTAKITQQLALSKASLWSPDIRIFINSAPPSASVAKRWISWTTTFGVRQVRFDANRGFFLNGKALKASGV